MASSPTKSPPQRSPRADDRGRVLEKKSPTSPPPSTSPSRPGGADDATSRRAKYARATSGMSRYSTTFDATRRRRSSYTSHGRRHSSFDLPHINARMILPADEKELEEIDPSKVPWWTSQRFLLSVVCFLGFVLLYAQRVNLSVTIVTMVIHTPKGTSTEGPTSAPTPGDNLTIQTTPDDGAVDVDDDDDAHCPVVARSLTGGEFYWNKPLQGLLLGSFYWGYLLLQVMGGMVSERFGAKRVIALGMFPVSILTLLSPVSARANPYLFLVVRILVGVGEGVMYPAAQALWANWAPPNERSRLIGFSYAGGQFGNAISFPISGFLCAYGFDGGWPSVYYVIGAVGFLWCVLWVWFAHDTPADNPRISDIEKRYIQIAVGNRMKKGKGRKTPWKAIFTSRGLWAILIAHGCGNYGGYMLLTQIPTYMKEVLKFDIKANGVFSMLPYLTFWFCITLSSLIADFLISKDIMGILWTRKMMSVIGLILPGAFLIATSYMDCNQQMGAVALLTIAVGLCGFHFSGYFINHGDIAPAFAGTLFGITNTAASIPGMLAPYVVAALTPNGTQAEWQTAFYVAAAVYFFGAIVYVLMAQGEVQPWAECDLGSGEPDADADAEGGVEEEAGAGKMGFPTTPLHDLHEEEEMDEAEQFKQMVKNFDGSKK